MEEVLKAILNNLCSKPYEINRVDGEFAIMFEVKIDSVDAPVVVGKKGSVADAIRTILYAMNISTKYSRKRIIFQVCVVEEE